MGREPDNGYAHYYAGMAYSRLNQADRIITHFERFLKLNPDAPEAAKLRSMLKSVRFFQSSRLWNRSALRPRIRTP